MKVRVVQRLGVVLMLALGIAACSTDDVLRPEVDIGQQTGAISPVGPRGDVPVSRAHAAAAAQPGPDDELVDNAANRKFLDEEQAERGNYSTGAEAGNDGSGEEAPAGGDVYRDPTLDVDAAPNQSLPVEAAPVEAAPMQVASLPRAVRPLPPAEPRVTAYPHLDQPLEDEPAAISADEVDCRKQLKRLGVKFQDIAPIRDSAACQIPHPVKVSNLGSVQLKPAATLTCSMALTFAQWTKNELQPSARWRYFSGVKTIRQGSSYSCRRIAGSRTQSAHSQGNALDVMSIELNNGKEIDVTKKSIFSFRERKLLNNVRADGCEYFTTVLGPGYNYDHRNHFHFDLMQRKKGRRACH